MRRVVIAAGLVAALLAACGGSSEECEAIADDGIELLQDFVDEVDAINPADLAAAVGNSDFLADLEAEADELDERAASAGCTEAQMAELLEARSDELEAATEVGQIIVDLILEEQFFSVE